MFGCPTCSNSLGRNNPNREGKTQTTKRLHQTTHVKYFTCLFRFPLCHITGLETSFSRPRFYRKILCLSLWWHLPCHERLRISQAPKGLTMVLSWPHQLTIYKFARIRKVVQESKTTNYRIYRSWTKWHVLWRIVLCLCYPHLRKLQPGGLRPDDMLQDHPNAIHTVLRMTQTHWEAFSIHDFNVTFIFLSHVVFSIGSMNWVAGRHSALPSTCECLGVWLACCKDKYSCWSFTKS